jgi:hypothetical protein
MQYYYYCRFKDATKEEEGSTTRIRARGRRTDQVSPTISGIIYPNDNGENLIERGFKIYFNDFTISEREFKMRVNIQSARI